MKKDKEKSVIRHILLNNQFSTKSLEEEIQETNHKRKTKVDGDDSLQKWATFAYIGKQTKYITKTLKKPVSK